MTSHSSVLDHPAQAGLNEEGSVTFNQAPDLLVG